MGCGGGAGGDARGAEGSAGVWVGGDGDGGGAREEGREFWAEMYADVQYNGDGMLVIDRVKKPWKNEDVEKHVTQQLTTQSVTATDGNTVRLPVKDHPLSLCCHSDSPGCGEIVKTARTVVDKFNKEHGYS
ncbi:MAG: hypothetical protein Q9208_006536 [Pyrenodesmia sp. 3 TL-2023]